MVTMDTERSRDRDSKIPITLELCPESQSTPHSAWTTMQPCDFPEQCRLIQPQRQRYCIHSDKSTESWLPLADGIINRETSQDSASPDTSLFILHPRTCFLLLSGNITPDEQREAVRRGMEARQTLNKLVAPRHVIMKPFVILSSRQ